MSLKLLKAMIPLMERFDTECCNSGKAAELDDFLAWLSQKDREIHAKPPEFQSPSMPLRGDLNAQITQLLSLMNKYLRFYLKKGFEGTLLSGPDDFGFLATLFMEGSLRKNELIEKNTMEFSSGIEVIKRLEKNELIESLPDNDDKRAKLVRITDSGREQFLNVLPLMGQIGMIATVRLDDNERNLLLELLKKLNHFHNPIFHQSKKETLSDILKTYTDNIT
jgi:MarR family transcriptional regulator, lower aerobic nicotinate degradation pathway regulator